MAARRKSAKPTNKLRHQVQIDDDDEEDDMDDSRMTAASASNATTPRELSKMTAISHITQQGFRTPCVTTPNLEQTVNTAQYLIAASHISEPHIALPSDIYQDFEALKSVTKLDTTELMRKLLKDYQKIASSNHSLRERKLDDVIGDLFASRSANALDLSKRKENSSSSDDCEDSNISVSDQGHRYTDDQLAMGMLDVVEGNDDSNELKPLDLTLHKNELPPSSDSGTAVDISVKTKQTSSVYSPLFKSFATHNDDDQRSQPFKHAGSYVINLEPTNESSSFANSSLAQVLQMDIPLRSFSKSQKYATESQGTLFLKEGKRIPSTSRATSSEVNIQKCQSNVHLRSKLFHDDKEISGISKISSHDTTPTALSGLPTYAEAITSVLSSQQNKRTAGDLMTEPLAGAQNVDKPEQDCQSNATSFVHINAEDADIKFVPLNVSSQLVTTTSSSKDTHKQQQNILQHILQHRLKSEHSPLHQQFQQFQQQVQNASITQGNPLNTFCSGQISHIQMMQVPGITSDVNDSHGISQAIKNNEVSYPNFLFESHAVGIPSIPTALSSGTVASSTLPTASMSVPTFFMTTSTNCGMGHMVAIPVIHAVPDGVTGLQPFAFAPHPTPASCNTQTVAAHGSADMILATPSDVSSLMRQSEEPLNHESQSSFSFTSEAKPSPPLTTVKPKPGRPRGRGGRGQSQKTQNKDMKLLTENTLFPGVYTSILKLPWSRRSRNKTKVKTISEIKKQAQIIAHGRVNEDGDHFIDEGGIKLEDTEHYKNNRVNVIDQTRPENTIEKEMETQLLQQDLQDQKYQIQQQKLKDLEQQQRLHLQYHLRLQEEQRKLTKQIEQSYLNMGTHSPLPIPFAVPTLQMLPDTYEMQTSDNAQKECSSRTVSIGNSVASDSMPLSQTSVSVDPVVAAHSNADELTPKKTPRKRGRPPKISNVPSKTTESNLTFKTEAAEQFEPENFLHTNVTVSNFVTSIADVRPHYSASILSRNASLSEPEKHVLMTASKSEEIEAMDDSDMTLEKKITFLTNQIGLELSKSIIAHSHGETNLTTSQPITSEDKSGNLEGTMYQEMKMIVNKSLVDVKPRRKKVSRLLKSDENFMYATFKIKPKGLTPRKSRRRRKDVIASTAAVAENTTNLRQKALHDSMTSCLSMDSSKPPSMVAWKFHEQYPYTNEEEESKDGKLICMKCGNCFDYESENAVHRQCETCLMECAELPSAIEDKEGALSNIGKTFMGDTEMKAECCVTCGNVFQKHFSDPGARCDACRNNAPGVIKSSKLFSFHDSPADSIPTGSLASKSSTTATFLAASDNSLKDETFSDKGSAKINNNHLFCGLCRMEFTKICEYLTHIRDTHETKAEKKIPLLSDSTAPNDIGRKLRVSKTKKSLAHKTLTCPVEECPHFFREQKDLDLHFMKKHSDLGTCPHGDCGFSYVTAVDLDHHLQLDHGLSTTTSAAANGLGNSGTETFNNTDKSGPTCEKPLQCEFCDYRCRQKNALTWHMRKHPEAASQYRKYRQVKVCMLQNPIADLMLGRIHGSKDCSPHWPPTVATGVSPTGCCRLDSQSW